MQGAQPVITARDRRQFAGFAAAVLVFIIDDNERLLLLRHPKRPDRWQVAAGSVEAGESILDAAIREAHEEVGADANLRPLGTVHTFTFHYEKAVPQMIDVCYLMAYEGGPIETGDDMAGSDYRWWTLGELADDSVEISVPRDQKWLMGRAVDLFRLWKDQDFELQPTSGSAEHSGPGLPPKH